MVANFERGQVVFGRLVVHRAQDGSELFGLPNELVGHLDMIVARLGQLRTLLLEQLAL